MVGMPLGVEVGGSDLAARVCVCAVARSIFYTAEEMDDLPTPRTMNGPHACGATSTH